MRRYAGLFAVFLFVTVVLSGCGYAKGLKVRVKSVHEGFEVYNLNGQTWKDVKMVINDEYVYQADRVEPTQKDPYRIKAGAVVKKDGTRFNPDFTKPLHVSIYSTMDNQKYSWDANFRP